MDWGAGDLVSIAVGLIFVALCLLIKRNRTFERSFYLLANGLSLGALLMIIFSPVAQLLGYHERLLELAVKDGKLALWWAAVVAALNLVKDSTKPD